MSRSLPCFFVVLIATLASGCAARRPQPAVAAHASPPPPPKLEPLPPPKAVVESPPAPASTTLLGFVVAGEKSEYSWQRPQRTPESALLSAEGAGLAPPEWGPGSERPALDTWGTDDEPSLPDPTRVVALLRPRFRACFARWLERSADAEGSVKVALELDDVGDVRGISAKSEGVDAATVECLFGVVSSAHFSPPAGGSATLHIPIVFKNANR